MLGFLVITQPILFFFSPHFVLQAGVNKVAELIGVTMGPKGRNVVLQNKYGPPKIVNDGETVLKQVLPHCLDLIFLIIYILFLLQYKMSGC